MTQEKPQPPGKTCERENLYLSWKNTAVDKNISHNLSQPEDKNFASNFVLTQKFANS